MVIDLGLMDTDEAGNFNPQETITKKAATDIYAKLYKLELSKLVYKPYSWNRCFKDERGVYYI